MDQQQRVILETFCDLIFVDSDHLEFTTFQTFIDNYIDNYAGNNIILNKKRHEIYSIVQQKASDYIRKCRNNGIPVFSFASDMNFHLWRSEFENYYQMKYLEKFNTNADCPKELSSALECIQEFITLYSMFEEFSVQLTLDATNAAKKEATAAAQEASMSAQCSAQEAKSAADVAAKNAANLAIRKTLDEKKIDDHAAEAVNRQINKMSSKISEHSVTILGIFSGIVLTVVAGLFYSSSVIDNINSANYFRLISVSAIIGLVCFNMMALLFFFVEKIRNSCNHEKRKIRFNGSTIFVSILLVIIMVISGICQYTCPEPSCQNSDEQTKVNVSGDINVSVNEEQESTDTNTTNTPPNLDD